MRQTMSYIFNGSIPGVLTTMPHIRLRKKTSLVVLLGVGAAAEVVPVIGRWLRRALTRRAQPHGSATWHGARLAEEG